MITIHYEVFALSVNGSDVIECDNLHEAIKQAKEFSKHTDNEVLIQEVTTRNVDLYFKGFQVKGSPLINEGVQEDER